MNCHLLYLLFASNVLLQRFLFSAFFLQFQISGFYDWLTAWGHSQKSSHLPRNPCACFCIFASCRDYARVWLQISGMQGSNFVPQHFKWIMIVATSGVLGGNLTVSQTTAKPCWILAIFFFLVNNCQTSWSGTMQDWIGKGQSNSLLLPFEVGI